MRWILRFGFMALGAFLLFFTGYAGAFAALISSRTASYDAAYEKVEIGQDVEYVYTAFGAPQGVYAHREGRFLVYRVNRLFFQFPVRWSIGIDSGGRVVTKERSDGGC